MADEDDSGEFEAFEAGAAADVEANVESNRRTRAELITAMRNQKANWQTDGLGIRGHATQVHNAKAQLVWEQTDPQRRFDTGSSDGGGDDTQTAADPTPPETPTPDPTPVPPGPIPPTPPGASYPPGTFLLKFFFGQDVGYPNSYGGFDGDRANVSSPYSGLTTQVRAVDLVTGNLFTVHGINFGRVDRYIPREGNIYAEMHNTGFVPFGAQPDFEVAGIS